MMEIKTERLLLRRARESDLADVNAFMSHAGAMQYWSTPPHRDLDQTRAWLQALIAAAPATSEEFVIEHEGRVIGEVGSDPLPAFGFILHPEFWGRGMGYEAASAAIGHIFTARPVVALMADVDPRNNSSIALLSKLGFQQCGHARRTFRVAGEWVDSAYFKLSRPSA